MRMVRRQFLETGMRMAVAASALASLPACGVADPCVDPDTLTTGQLRLRESFHDAARSPHGEAQRCAGCAFFRPRAGDPHGCGECEILQGPVNGRGFCDSWSRPT